jgi:ribulose 1,5-bisphosphate synthetase/thiazole synthase
MPREDKQGASPEKRSHIILQKPLPEIIDDIEVSIKESEAAAADARQAADEARMAGEMAAEAVMKRIRRLFLKMADDITQEMNSIDKKK